MVINKISEKDCWFVIGAHQAGATERQCAALSGLSKTVIHNIITNFKKMGSPHATTLSMDTLLDQNTASHNDKKRKMNDDKNIPRKRGRPRKPVEPPLFAQSIMRNALTEARRSDQNSPPIYPLDRLNTPPSDEDPSHEYEKMAQRRKSKEEDMLPLTPRSGLDESDEEEERWTVNDDEELIKHVFGLPMKNVKWRHVEAQFQDRHLAKMCSERWDFLKRQLLRDIATTKETLLTNNFDTDDNFEL